MSAKISTATPALKKNQLMTLEFSQSGRVPSSYEGKNSDGWWIRIDRDLMVAPQKAEPLNITFAKDGILWSGKSYYKAMNQKIGVVCLQEPDSFKIRPIRKVERFATEFQTALIIRNNERAWPNFIPRNESNIINLSTGGILLASYQPLENYQHSLLLLLSLDSQQPYNTKNQICLRGKIVRQAEEAKNEYTPYAYGIEFQNVRPFEKEKLQHYINKIKLNKNDNILNTEKNSASDTSTAENIDELEVLETLD